MKDQYAADVNDYRKYGILRALGMPTAVNWMLTAADGRSDGRHTAYAEQPERFRSHDPDLFDALAALLAGGSRSVAEIERRVLIPSARYFAPIVPDRAPAREAWFGEALEHAAGSHLLFFDPDNGMEVASTRKGHRGSSKFLYWDEVTRAFQRGHSLLVYQHFPRRERSAFLADLASKFRAVTGAAQVTALVTSNVAFFLVPQPGHTGVLDSIGPSLAKSWQGQVRLQDHR
jgi:hypothetical protein